MAKIRVASPGEYDRHDNVVRFSAHVDGHSIGFVIDPFALFVMREALEIKTDDPLQVYQVGGRLLAHVIERLSNEEGHLEPSKVYYLTHEIVLRVTGRSGDGNSFVPKKWVG